MVRARPTSSVCPDGLVGPQSKTKATRHVDLIRAQLVEVECGTVAAPFGLALGVPIPGQHPTPREGKEGGGIVAPLIPGCRQIKQLLCRGDPVASDASMQLAIAAFGCSIQGEGSDPIRRPIADIVRERFDMTKPSHLKEPAQSLSRIRLGYPSCVSRAIGECVGLLPLADLSNRRCAGRRGISSDISGATGRPLLPLEGTHAMICHRGAICRRHQRIKLKQATRRFGPQTICEHGSSAKHAGPSLDI